MSAPTAAQINTLLDFLEEHRDLARGSLRNVEGRVLSHKLWLEITTTLNAMGGCTKTTKQWQKIWTDKKYLAKKAAVFAQASASATGDEPQKLTQLEMKIISIIGERIVEPQKSDRGPEFDEPASPEATKVEPSDDFEQSEESEESFIFDPLPDGPDPVSIQIPVTQGPSRRSPAKNIRSQRRHRRVLSPRADNSEFERLVRLEERRVALEEERNLELAGIRASLESGLPGVRLELANVRSAFEELSGLMHEFLQK